MSERVRCSLSTHHNYHRQPALLFTDTTHDSKSSSERCSSSLCRPLSRIYLLVIPARSRLSRIDMCTRNKDVRLLILVCVGVPHTRRVLLFSRSLVSLLVSIIMPKMLYRGESLNRGFICCGREGPNRVKDATGCITIRCWCCCYLSSSSRGC